MEPAEKASLDNGWKIINTIWIGMLISLAAYLMLPIYYSEKLADKVIEDIPVGTIRNVFLVVAIATIVLVRWVRKWLMSRSAAGSLFLSKEMPVHTHPVVSRYIVAVVVSLAMSESIGLYGLVLYLVGRNTQELIFFVVISIGAMIYYRPRKMELAGML